MKISQETIDEVRRVREHQEELRKQEEENLCIYCRDAIASIKLESYLGSEYYIPYNYCPVCGKKLKRMTITSDI
jgi:hypothetical protein